MKTTTDTVNAVAAHSPGPWDTQRAMNMGGMPEPAIHIMTAGDCPRILATVKSGRQFAPMEDLEANARLIAAAPELLAALQDDELSASHDRMSALLEDEDAENDDIREAALDIVASLMAFQSKARAAIARATA